jgi:hypothetical protein
VSAVVDILDPIKSWPQFGAISRRIREAIKLVLTDAACVKIIEEQWHAQGNIASFGSHAFSPNGKLLCYIKPYRNVIVSNVQSGKVLWS